MDVGQKKGTPRDWEDTLEKIRGVLSVRVMVKDNQVTTVQVLARAGRHPKQLTRDVVSVLLARHGLELDPKLVNVAQVESSEDLIDGPGRARLAALDYRFRGNWVEIDVSLEYGGRLLSGSAQGSAVASHPLRLVAQATLGALAAGLPGMDVLFTVEDVSSARLAGWAVMVVGVGVVGPDGDEVLTGSCLVRGDEREAVARATLDAVNRRFALLVARDGKTL